MIAQPVKIEYRPDLPIFASERFLKAVGDEYGWLGGFDRAGNLRCILPYTIISKAMLRMVRFRVETIPIRRELEIEEEKSFLNSAMIFFRKTGMDLVAPATNNAIFRTFPDGADAAPYGSYIIDLRQPENDLWYNMQKILRQNIKSAQNNGVIIKSGINYTPSAFLLIRDTFKRSNLPFMNLTAFKRYIEGLGENGILMAAELQGAAQSYALFAYSDYCAYAIYSGSIINQQQGSNKLLLWEAIRLFKNLGVQLFDFYGARVNPEAGSKQAELAAFKKRFGAQFRVGYIWKCSLNPSKYKLYNFQM